jgi:hypothetical protein
MVERDESGLAQAQKVLNLFIQAIDVWRDLERVFPIRDRNRFTNSDSASEVTEQELQLEEREFWYRLVLAANFRKFVNRKEVLYLPDVLQALIDLGKISADNDDVGLLRKEFEAVYAGRAQILSFDDGQGNTLSAFETVNSLLHGLFLHGNPKLVAEIGMVSQGLRRHAVFEWLDFYRPLLELLAKAATETSEGGEWEPDIEKT